MGSRWLSPMGLSGLEPPTSRLSGVRSNRLSYKPIYSGSHLLSRAVSSKVPSAAWVLTIVFGMGTGVTPRRIATGKIRYPVVSAQSDGGDRWKLASVRSYTADCISGSAATE